MLTVTSEMHQAFEGNLNEEIPTVMLEKWLKPDRYVCNNNNNNNNK